RVLVTDPGYPCHRHVAGVMGGEAVKVPLDKRHQLSEEVVTNFWDDRSRALILASPSNPTGALTSDKTLAAITDFVRSRDGALISDEIYHGLTYGRDAPSALVFSDQVFVINSFSKYWGMTGWRLGWLIGPPSFAAELERLAQNLFLASSTIAQHAALAAFLPETLAIVEDRRKEFHSRRDLMLPALADTGFEIDARPEGAFYIYARCTRFSPDSAVFCDELLEKAGVALTPGIDFGSHRAHEHLRFAYTANSARLMEAIQRIGNFVRSL
ncbi:MAG: aminotransferase class I/II-fold pyridoxal phosphate-dependent enzyme, partial [Burkholderiales bacterium]